MSNGHSKLFSPSAAPRWMRCPGSVALTKDMPDETSKFAEEGTLAHEVAAMLLQFSPPVIPEGVEQEMVDYAQVYADYVLSEQDRTGGQLYIEQQVHFSATLGVNEGEATGTADAIIVSDDEIVVIDLKYGRGVQVFAESEQLKLYALGAMEAHDPLGLIDRFKLVIVQPRLDHIDELVLTRAEMEDFASDARVAAEVVLAGVAQQEIGLVNAAWADAFLAPSEKACQWCKAKATCPALSKAVAETVGVAGIDDMEDLTAETVADPDALTNRSHLSSAMARVGMIEDWCKAVRAAVEGELIAGRAVPGYKLVEGRRGARSWSDETAAEELLRKTFRLKVEEAYNLKLISPTQAEKLIGDSPRRWNKAKALITQGQGKPSVAPESDKRPAITVSPDSSGMESIEAE